MHLRPSHIEPPLSPTPQDSSLLHNIVCCVSTAVVNCGTLSNPSNGVVQFLSSSSAGGDVMYVCDPGYELVGNSGRECLCSSQWSGSEPVCQGINTPTTELGGSFGAMVDFTVLATWDARSPDGSFTRE